MTGTKEYFAWGNMKQRCSNPNFHQYADYGGRGISYDTRWESFEEFYKDMGDAPSDFHSLERSNNELGYSPQNCFWATQFEQSFNKRLYKNNTSGVKGVGWQSDKNRWRAWCQVNGKSRVLYAGPSFDSAVAARQNWEASNL